MYQKRPLLRLIMRWAARLIGVLLIAYSLTMILSLRYSSMFHDTIIVFAIIAFYAAAGLIVSRREEWAAALFLGFVAVCFLAMSRNYVPWLTGLCFLPGLLFFGSWLLSLEETKNKGRLSQSPLPFILFKLIYTCISTGSIMGRRLVLSKKYLSRAFLTSFST